MHLYLYMSAFVCMCECECVDVWMCIYMDGFVSVITLNDTCMLLVVWCGVCVCVCCVREIVCVCVLRERDRVCVRLHMYAHVCVCACTGIFACVSVVCSGARPSPVTAVLQCASVCGTCACSVWM